MRSSFQRRLLASTLLLGLTTPAFAQTADDADEGTIVVTGSRIARPDLQQASPIAIVSAQELKLSGKVNVEAIINDLPQLVPSATGASTKPGGGVHHVCSVDPDDAAVQLRGDIQSDVDVFRPDTGREPVTGVVGERDGLRWCAECHGHQNGAKDFFLHQSRC